MAAIMRLDTTPLLTRRGDEVTRMLSRALGDARAGQRSTWAPALDVVDTPEAIVLSADLPGVRQEDVSIELHEGVLTLAGERHMAEKVEEGRYHRLERSYGRFARRLTLPKDVKADEITASFEAGVLEVRVPKAEPATPRRIPVGTAA